MALSSGIVWQVMPTGTNANGGGFDPSYTTGTDYSQQEVAQITFQDLAVRSGVATNRVWSTIQNANMTTACIGNVLRVNSGGSAIDYVHGWYLVIGYGSGGTGSNYFDLDRNCCAAVNSESGWAKLGGAVGVPQSAWSTVLTGGNKVWFKSGTYTLTTSGTVAGNTAKAPVRFEGYDATRGDDPTGTHRPLIIADSLGMVFTAKNEVKNIRIAVNVAAGVTLGAGGVMRNCNIDNSSVTSARIALTMGSPCVVWDSDIQCTNGVAIGNAASTDSLIMNSYIHDACVGIRGFTGGIFPHTFFNVFNKVDLGCAVRGASTARICNNTFHSCLQGITIDTDISGLQYIFFNNIFSSCATALQFATGFPLAYLDYSNFFANTTDTDKITKGTACTTFAPNYTDTATEIFSLSGSSCIDGGFGYRIGVA